jgi:HK97 family phage major capsid protein
MNREQFRRLAPTQQLAQLRGSRGERRFHVDRAGIDENARTVWLSIASEAPYERWWGIEILSLESGAIRSARLASGAPLLVGHDTGDQIGVIDDYTIAGKRLRVKARFSRSQRAEEIFQDVVDGIRINASVGYIIHDLVLEKQEEEVSTYRVTDWEPLEGSLVAVPADITVGVGRAHQPITERTPMEREQERGGASAAEKEVARRRELIEAGEVFKAPELALEMIDAGGSVEEFKSRLLERQRAGSRPLPLGTDTSQQARVPYGEGLRLRYAHGPLKAFTRDFAIERGGALKGEEAAFRAGMWLAATVHDKAWAKKWCREHAMPMLYRDHDGEIREITGAEIRAQSENMLSAGAALVPVELEAAVIMLRDRYGAARQLARIRPMNSDTLKIPRRKTGLTAYFFQDDDGVGITESSKNWDSVGLSTKKLGVLNKLSRDLTEDSVISVVDDAANEMAYAFAVKEDQCLLIGDGSATYGRMTGINPKFESTAYVSRTALQTGHDTMAEVDNIDVTTVMGNVAQYADTPGAVFVCSNLFKHGIFNRLKAIAGGNRLDVLGQSPDNSFLGYQIVTSEAMPKVTTTLLNKVMFLFGRFDLAASFGSRRGIEVQVLMERYAELGLIGVIASERFDIVVHDLGTTSSSDINGGRGPISAAYGA